jgi:hypothetical protein
MEAGPIFEPQEKCTRQNQEDCYVHVNEAMEDWDFSLVQKSINSVVLVTSIVALLSIKWRHLATYLFYFETLFRLLVMFKPNSRYQSASPSVYMYEHLSVFIMLYCGGGCSFFIAIIALVIRVFVSIHYVYDKPLNSWYFLMNA